ncbi:MAG: hypothetical protein EHM63_08900, partial [Actinobacteria bacterium]
MIAEQTEATFDQPLVLIAAFVVGCIAVARIVRLIVDDDFPPVLWVRRQIVKVLPPSWIDGLDCPWCVAPYVAIIDIVWAWSSGLHWSWWLGNVWAAVAWIAAYLCMRDVPED